MITSLHESATRNNSLTSFSFIIAKGKVLCHCFPRRWALFGEHVLRQSIQAMSKSEPEIILSLLTLRCMLEPTTILFYSCRGIIPLVDECPKRSFLSVVVCLFGDGVEVASTRD